MNSEPFVIERSFNAPVEKIWKAITDKQQMKQWYFDVPEFKPETPQKNFDGEFDGIGTSLLPGTHNTDGFYVATLRRQT